MSFDQFMAIHWPFGDVNITVDGRNPASGEIDPIEGVGMLVQTQASAKIPKISSAGGVGNVRGSGRSRRTTGKGGFCG